MSSSYFGTEKHQIETASTGIFVVLETISSGDYSYIEKSDGTKLILMYVLSKHSAGTMMTDSRTVGWGKTL